MKKKYLISTLVATTLLFLMAPVFGQDTSKLPVENNLKNKPDSLNTAHPGSGIRETEKPHASVNPNRGTAVPASTSGTLGSSVNPNTQFVIPFHKNKKKSNATAVPDSGIIVPKK